MKKITQITVMFMLLIFSCNAIAQVAGDLDTTFNSTDLGFGYGDGANNTVNATAIQSDGKIIIGGAFDFYNGTARNRIARLNPNGTLDTSFSVGTGANGTVYTITIQSDGKIIIGGSFTVYNGTARNRVARLNTDGTLDTSFIVGSGANVTVNATMIQPDGKIIIGGNFTTYNGTARNYIARLNTDGTLDTSFIVGTGANSAVSTIAIQSDGKIIIGGGFTIYNGTNINRIARLNTDGTLDTSFVVGTGANNGVNNTAIQPDGKIIIGGTFTSYNGTAIYRIARLNTDGTLDTSFAGNSNGPVYSIAVQSDGKIIIGGSFISYSGMPRIRIARLNTDGTLDTSFVGGTGVNGNVLTTSIQSDGKIIIGGIFTIYNGIPRNRIARLNTDGTLDTPFGLGTGASSDVNTTAIQPDGKIIIGGSFVTYNGTAINRIARLNTDGTLDSSFTVGTGANNGLIATAIQSDEKIIIGGAFVTYNGTPINYIARLNTDGTLDASFAVGTGANSIVNTIAIQPDGKIIIGGLFTTYNGTARNYIARLNTDGTLDTSFTVGAGANSTVSTIAIQSDGKIIIGGGFTSYNGTPINYIARLNVDGTLDPSFVVASGADNAILTTAIQPDGKIIIGGGFNFYNVTARNFIARLNSDGTLDTSFVVGAGTNGTVYTITIQPDGKIIMGGAFTNYNGTARNYIARLNTDGTLDTTFAVGTGANNGVNTTALQPDGKIIMGGVFTAYNGIGRNRIARIHGVDFLSTPNFEILSNLNVYPNPSTGIYNIAIDENVIMEVYDLVGKQMFSEKINKGTSTLDMSDYNAGIYLLKMTNENNQSKTIKIVKQ